MGALQVILQLLALLPDAIQTTEKVVAIVERVKALYASGTEPTDEDWDSLNATLASLKAELDADPPLTGV